MPFFRIPCLVLSPTENPLACLRPPSTLGLSPSVHSSALSISRLLVCLCRCLRRSMHKSLSPSHPLRHSVDSFFNFRPIFPPPRPSSPVRSPRFRSILTSQSLPEAPRKEKLKLQSNFLLALISISVESIRPKTFDLKILPTALSFFPLPPSPSIIVHTRTHLLSDRHLPV
jgi:hypothetical protein